MEFSESHYPFNQLIDTPFSNLLDDEIPQDIFEEIMNDINGGMMEVNSMSSEDSGRSSISYDDNRPASDTTPDQMIVNLKEEQMVEMLSDVNSSGSEVVMHHLEVVEIAQPVIASDQPSFASIKQPQLMLPYPKILVKKEPIAFQPQTNNIHSIVRLQNIGGQLYTTVPSASQTTVQTIGNGSGSIIFAIFYQTNSNPNIC